MKILIVGRGFAGLVLALELGVNGGEIVIIDSDPLEKKGKWRRGVPQARHTHTLSAKGYSKLLTLIPDLDEILDRHGAPRLHWGTTDTEILTETGLLSQNKPLGIVTRNVSRGLLEDILLSKVRAMPNVRFVENSWVTGLLWSDLNSRVIGVNYIQNSSSFELKADKIVLANGVASNWGKWLWLAGYPRFPVIEVNANLTYFTADFEGLHMTSKLRGVAESVEHPYAGVIAEIEGGIFRVTVFVYRFDGVSPKNERQFVDLIQKVDTRLYDIVATGRMIGDIHVYSNCVNRTTDIVNISHWPEDLYVLGDCFTVLNPKYGQGMTVSLKQAHLLATALTKNWSSQKTRRELQKTTNGPWALAVGADYRHLRHVNGMAPKLGRMERVFEWYLKCIQGYDMDVFLGTVLRIPQIEVSPLSLFGPQMLLAFVRSFMKR